MNSEIRVVAELEPNIRDTHFEELLSRHWERMFDSFEHKITGNLNIKRHRGQFIVKSKMYWKGHAFGQSYQSESLLDAISHVEKRCLARSQMNRKIKDIISYLENNKAT